MQRGRFNASYQKQQMWLKTLNPSHTKTRRDAVAGKSFHKLSWIAISL